MQVQIQPKWFSETKVTCACGTTYDFGSTQESVSVQICAACHPFYTGQMKFIDTRGRVDAFRAKQQQKHQTVSKTARRQAKKDKKIKEETSLPESLSELRKTLTN